MLFGLEKCGQMVVKRRKIVQSDGVELPVSHITDIQTGYKYLGILQSHENHTRQGRQEHPSTSKG